MQSPSWLTVHEINRDVTGAYQVRVTINKRHPAFWVDVIREAYKLHGLSVFKPNLWPNWFQAIKDAYK